jgi:type VI secretion system protein
MTLLDTLLNDIPHAEHSTMHSIQLHLERLFNTRRGSLKHLPHYGLPDMNEIFQNLPDSTIELINAIKYSIEHYEPRLNNVIIAQTKNKDGDGVINLVITAMMSNAQGINYLTFFLGDGHAIVKGR